MQPKSTPKQIARQALGAIRIAQSRGAEKVVVIIDREDRQDCHIDWAREIEAALVDLGVLGATVVVKNRKFENWLIADPDGLSSLKDFSVSNAKKSLVVGNKADHVTDAARWLGDCSASGYAKGKHQEAICKVICFRRMAENSRSFRCFLRRLGHPAFPLSSKAIVSIP
jgi:hypothetical protein